MYNSSNQASLVKVVSTIKSYFDPFIETDLSAWMILINFIHVRQVGPRQIIKADGDRENMMRFILSGCGVKVLKEKYLETCIDICMENQFFTDFESFDTGQPTKVYLKTVEAMELVEIPVNVVKALCDESATCAQLKRIVAEQEAIKLQRNHTYTIGIIGEKYERLFNERREIIRRVPLYYIATFIRANYQSLCRARGN